METILQVKGLQKSFPIGKTETQIILENINVSIKQKEFVVVMGASGSGKSTLLYNVSGMDQPDKGSISFMNHQLDVLNETKLAKVRLESMGYIFQQSNLLRNLNIFDNIVLPAYKLKKESHQTINKRANNLMKHLGIEELENKDITQASGGQLQRVAIARALINNPTMLFGDEPTGALNSSTTIEVMNILKEIHASGTTILLVTHDIKVAAYANRVIYMKDGYIDGETHPILEDSLTKREKYLSAWLKDKGF